MRLVLPSFTRVAGRATLLLAGVAPVAAAPFVAAPLVAQPATDSLAPAARVARVEADLRSPVQVRGRPIGRKTVAERMRELNVPAVSIAVVEGGRVAWARAYGLADVASGRRATTTTLFQAASISKPVASTGALQLVADGKLALDGEVNGALRTWRIPSSEASGGRPVTLRHLLTHTGGLTVHGFPGYAADSLVPTTVQVLDGARPANTAAVRIDTTPGARWRYSGGGMTVMQLLMSDVTGKPFDVLMHERVLEPAGMARSTYAQPLPEHLAAEAATGYRRGGVAVPGRYHTYPEQAAAGLWTTPSDLGRWVLAIQRAHAGSADALLPRPLAEAMLTPGLGNWGLGVAIEDTGAARRFSHGGANEGFRATVVGYVTGGRGVAVMTNSDMGSAIASELVAAVAREYGWPGYAPREIVPVPLAAERLAEFAGRYTLAGAATPAVIAVRDGGLWITLPGDSPRELIPVGGDAFTALPGGATRFERDAGGRVSAVFAGNTRLSRAP
jgi:CubicO group peptidase (beta-lactamase class C family)